jgi:hypothetical protein
VDQNVAEVEANLVVAQIDLVQDHVQVQEVQLEVVDQDDLMHQDHRNQEAVHVAKVDQDQIKMLKIYLFLFDIINNI